MTSDKVVKYGTKVGLGFLGYFVSDLVGRKFRNADPRLIAVGKAGVGVAIGVYGTDANMKSVGVGVGIDALTDAKLMLYNGSSSSSSEADKMGGVI